MNARSRGTSGWRRLVAVAGMFALVAGMIALTGSAANAADQQAGASQSTASAAQTTRDYVIRYWPRYLTYYQQISFTRFNGYDTLVGPQTISPAYNAVVAINDDTLYASAFLDMRQGPAILTIPATPNTYSLLLLDMFGNRIPTDAIPSQTPGTYALVPVGYQGTLPSGATRVEIPYDVTLLTLRVDKYSSTGVDQQATAATFRESLRLTTLANYQADPTSGPSKIVPLVPTFVFSFKLSEDLGAQYTPNVFLRAVQRAVHDPTTQPLSASDRRLSRQFDEVYGAAQQAARRGNPRQLRAIERATGETYHIIVANWKDSASSTGWVHPTNFAEWGTDYLDRASGSEYIQLGNNLAAAGYWQAFVDGRGRELNGARHDYTLTFAADQIPDAQRFWSLTLYSPNAVEPVPNPLNKYLVARYTPGLVYNADGSVTIYISVRKPTNVPTANWLPARRGLFNVMLRVYGPTGNTAPDADYNPPGITVAR